MKIILQSTVLLYSFCCLFSCANSIKTSQSKADYIPLSINESIEHYIGKQISLEGTIAIEIYQHMMKGSIVEEKHVYIDYHKGKQIVAYYTQLNIPKDNKSHTFYGTVQKITGAGKGGGTHTEYYIDLNDIQ